MTALWDLRCGRWQDALADVGEVDAVITDPPYSARTHEGQCSKDGMLRRPIGYDSWGPDEIADFVGAWVSRCRGWFVALSDSDLCGAWRTAFEAAGLTGFHPLPIVIPGMTVRLSGDGPSSWAIYANVARPKALHRWGTLPGAYRSPAGNQRKEFHIGSKPLVLMRALIRDYTRPGDLVCDPCAGGATTLLAASIEGRRSIGAEMDPVTYAKARRRLEAGHTPDLFTNVGG